MHTEGDLPPGVCHDDKFCNNNKKKERLVIDVGTVLFWIMPQSDPNNDGRVTVRLSSEFYRDVKYGLWETAIKQDRKRLVYEFHKLNGFPAWAGIIQQKRRLSNL